MSALGSLLQLGICILLRICCNFGSRGPTEILRVTGGRTAFWGDSVFDASFLQGNSALGSLFGPGNLLSSCLFLRGISILMRNDGSRLTAFSVKLQLCPRTFSLRNNRSLLPIRSCKHIFGRSNVAHGGPGVVAVFKFLCGR